MTTDTFVLLSGSLSFGVPLLYAVHDLIALRRAGPGLPPRRELVPVEPANPPPGGAFAGKALPACLIPVRQAAPQPVRELA